MVPAHIVIVHFVFNTAKPATYSIFLMSTSWSSDAIWRNGAWLSERFWLLGYGLGTLSLKPTHRRLIIDETIENLQMGLLKKMHGIRLISRLHISMASLSNIAHCLGHGAVEQFSLKKKNENVHTFYILMYAPFLSKLFQWSIGFIKWWSCFRKHNYWNWIILKMQMKQMPCIHRFINTWHLH